jgi:DNA-binding SARP family transcriptional activator
VLLVYLTVTRAGGSRREELIEALWPWRPPRGADASLSALLSRLRVVLGGDVLTRRDQIRLCLPSDAWIDLEAAEEAIHRAESAVALGVGGSELASGEKCARELVAREPFRERAHELLMELLAARGNVAEALRLYEGLRVRLRDELGAAPAGALRDLQQPAARLSQRRSRAAAIWFASSLQGRDQNAASRRPYGRSAVRPRLVRGPADQDFA